jgi:elongation factor 2
MEDEVYELIKAGELPEIRVKKKDPAIYNKLAELGWAAKDAQKVKQIYKGNFLIDGSRGIVHIGEVIEMVMDGFQQVIDGGILAKEPCVKMKVYLMDMKLHEDAIHRGPAQVLPAVRESVRLALGDAKATMFEPLQILQIESPAEFLGEISKLIQNKRGQLLDMTQEGEHMTVKAKLPVAEMFGLSNDLRSGTGGRGTFYIVDQVFEKVPEMIQNKLIKQIRDRKGLKTE